MRRKFYSLVAVLGLSGGFASAAMTASDNAANYISPGWSLSAANLGSGFGAWASYATNNNNPPYAGTYLDTFGGAPNTATSGANWATYANTPGTAIPEVDLVRPFTPAAGGYSDPSTLGTLYNQTFSMAMSSGGVGNAGQAMGFSLDTGQGASATANPVFTLEYAGGGGDNMTLIDNVNDNSSASGPLIVPVPYATGIGNGLLVSVAVGSNPDGVNPYTVTITSAASPNAVLYTYSDYTNGPIQQVDMFDLNTTGNSYFNSLAISPEAAVPEPASIGLLGAGAFLAIRRRRAAK